DPMVPNTWGAGRIIRRIQWVAPYPGNGYDIRIPLHSGVHSPDHVLQVKAVYILIDQKYMFQLAESGKCQKGSLSVPSLVRRGRLFKLEHCHVFSSSRGSAVHILE